MATSFITPTAADVYQQIPPHRRRQFYLLIGLMLLGAASELLAIGSVLPFLSLLSDPSALDRVAGVTRLFVSLGADTRDDQLVAVTSLFAAAAVFSAAVRVVLTWASQAFAFGLGHDLSIGVHRRLLYQPYSFHIGVNSSELLAVQAKIQSLLFTVVLPFMQAVTAAIISTFIVAVLFWIDPFIAATAAAGFCVVYVVTSYTTRRRLRRNGEITNETMALRVRAVQESLGGIRDIIIDQSQSIYLAEFEAVDARYHRAQVVTGFIGGAPRFVVEAAGMILIAGITLLMTGRSGGFAAAIPVLGALALSAQRLLPLLQQIYFGWAQMRGNWPLAMTILHYLRLEVPQEELSRDEDPLPFEKQIRFDQVSFTYPARSEPALQDVELIMPRGASIAVVGTTGSGKSTFVDLLMGLLEPTKGRITVDGVALLGDARRRWRLQIAHVPQAIFLADASIARNIAFGSAADAIDYDRIREAARQAQLDNFVETLPEGYDTRVGERGVRLSGGQRQRLGIARALYKDSRVLVLDEATSALDDATEASVMASLQALRSKGLTIVMIAHRLSTIADCDLVVRLENGRIASVGTFGEVVGGAPRALKHADSR